MGTRFVSPPLLLCTFNSAFENHVSKMLLARMELLLPQKAKRRSLDRRQFEQQYHTYPDIATLQSDIKSINGDNAVVLYDYPSQAAHRHFRIVQLGHEGAQRPTWCPKPVTIGVQVASRCDLDTAAHQLLSVFLLDFNRQCIARKRSYPRLRREDAMENLFPMSAGDQIRPTGW